MPHSVSPGSSPKSHEIELPDATDTAVSSPLPANVEPGEAASRVHPGSVFDEDDFSDDENTAGNTPIMSSSTDSSTAAKPVISAFKSPYSDPEVMRAFYQRLFPYRYLFQWLNHSSAPTSDFGNREFAFTLPNDAYLRYQSFSTHDLFRKQCIALVPSRFEIGPVYSTNPRDRKSLRRAAAFRPITKELVFDIDMTDYDEIRTCCTGANICYRCWSFIRMAISTIDVALREDFGFRHVLWVYSGRRGVHAWVCDRRARELDDRKRTAIASYMELLKGGDGTRKKVNIRRPLHPHLERSLRILRDNFQHDILREQDPWRDDERAKRLLDLLPDPTLNEALAKKWADNPGTSSSSKWKDIDTLAETGQTSASFDSRRLLEAKQDVVLEYTYPRLDSNVSKHLNHLLKSPFCVHPGTGRICVPIDPANVDDFDPLAVPTVTELLAEIDSWSGGTNTDMAEPGDRKLPDWEKTSLKPYVERFRHFVMGLLKEEQGGKRRRGEGEPTNDMEF